MLVENWKKMAEKNSVFENAKLKLLAIFSNNIKNKIILSIPILISWIAIIAFNISTQNFFKDFYNQYNSLLMIITIVSTICLVAMIILLNLIEYWEINKTYSPINLPTNFLTDFPTNLPNDAINTKLKHYGIMQHIDCIVTSPFFLFRGKTYGISSYRYSPIDSENIRLLNAIKNSDRCFLLWNDNNIPFENDKIRLLILKKNKDNKWIKNYVI